VVLVEADVSGQVVEADLIGQPLQEISPGAADGGELATGEPRRGPQRREGERRFGDRGLSCGGSR
jgi:hypothetical protein